MQRKIVTRKSMKSVSKLVALLAGMVLTAILPFVVADHSHATLEVRKQVLVSLEQQMNRLTTAGKFSEGNYTIGLERRVLAQGSTPGIASANLQQLLQGLATRHRGQIRSFQVQPARIENKLRSISIILVAHFDIRGLRDFVHTLETGEPFLFVDKMSVQRLRKPNAQAKPTWRPLLNVSIEVSGRLLGDDNS